MGSSVRKESVGSDATPYVGLFGSHVGTVLGGVATRPADGCRDPLVTWNGVLLDGHNRLAICQGLNLPFKTVALDLPDELDATIWTRTNQAGRRNLSDDQRAMNAAALAALLSEQATRERAAKGGMAGGKNHPQDLSLHADATGKLKDRSNYSAVKSAKTARVSENKVRMAQHVSHADPDLAALVVSGEINLAGAVREIRRRNHISSLENIATKKTKAIAGLYDVIVIEPPWPYNDKCDDSAVQSRANRRPMRSGLV